MNDKQKGVVITTENRGVFFGYVKDDSECPAKIILLKCRMGVYWDADTKGVLGLAATGPTSGCRITHSTPEATLYKVTGIFECTPEAVVAWENSVWK